MHDLKKINSVLLAAVLTFATTASPAVAAPAAASSSPQAWTYWKSDASALNVQGCATEVAKFHDGADVAFLFRSPSDAACAQAVNALQTGPAEVVMFKQEAMETDVVGSVRGSSWKERALEALSVQLQESTAEVASGQMAFQLSIAPQSAPQILSAHDSSLLVAVTDRSLSTIDMHATFDTRLERLFFRPIATLGDDDIEKPEPTFKKPKYNSVVAKIASSSALNPARIVKDLRILTAEDPQPRDPGKWYSRHSATYGARLAGAWIKQQLEQSLAPLNGSSCDYFEYSPYFAPNIVCRSVACSLLPVEMIDKSMRH